MCATAALQARQARMLPRFGAVVVAARLHEVMGFSLTLAVVAIVAEWFGLEGCASAPNWRPFSQDVSASAALLGVCSPRSYGALLAPRLVGAGGLAWLGQPVAMRELTSYPSGRTRANCGESPTRRRFGSAL